MNMDISTQNASARAGGNTERRETSRFPLQQEVRYRLLSAKAEKLVGQGKTLNIGSGGILFTTEGQLPLGRTVELSVNWPARLGGTCLLQFVAVGRVVRAEADHAAVRIERYEFKTRGAGSLPSASIV